MSLLAAPPTAISPRRVAIKVAGLASSAGLPSKYRFLLSARRTERETTIRLGSHRPASIKV